MNLKTRLSIYATIIAAYLLFGILKTFYDIWPWGAVIIGVCIALAEIGTRISIKKRIKDGNQ
jgi:hypothetical protein